MKITIKIVDDIFTQDYPLELELDQARKLYESLGVIFKHENRLQELKPDVVYFDNNNFRIYEDVQDAK